MDELNELLGESPSIAALRDKLHLLLHRQRAGQRLPSILIQGETGTGKGLIARLLHRYGARARAPFVDLNCAAIPETLLEAELFGFERGAFTDARHAKPGLFQTAHGGVLFLDEVSLLPESLQGKLLTAIEDRAVRRLGSTRSEHVDIWLISATNADLKWCVGARRFREDLYHRLAVLTLDVPPLRDRGRDVLLLAERFLARTCAEYGLPTKRLHPTAEARLLAYTWPGNIRELANVIERAVLFADGPVVTAHTLGPLETGSAGTVVPSRPPATATSRDQMLRRDLLAALEETQWNVSHAAARLGIARNTVYARLAKFGLRPDASGEADPARVRPVAAPAVATTPTTALQWERRSITLLRADLRCADGVGAPAQTGRALETVIGKVQSFGGRVEEVSLASLVAAFGLDPVEDGPRRAAHAAMAIQKAAQRTRESDGSGPVVTIGLHVAPVLTGVIGTRIEIDANAKRDQWVLLEQLLHGTKPGETVASGATAPFLERRFELASTGEGLEKEKSVYLLTGRERPGLGLWGAMTPFVGRRLELEALRRQLALAGSGEGQVVTLLAEAGMGKSRLIHEVAHACRPAGWRIVETTATSYEQATSYAPVVSLLRTYFAIHDRDDVRDVREKVTGKLLALDGALAPSLPALLALLDVPVEDHRWLDLDPAQRRQQTLDAVKRLLVREAHVQPLMTIFEDLHWIDTETQALLDALVESVPASPMLLLLSCRPEYRHAWGGKTYYTRLRLDPLPSENADELLDALLGRDVSLVPLKSLLAGRTGRNPLFMEESVRALVETNIVQGDRGAYRLVEHVDTIEVPATVEAILAARINRLPADDKRLLETAAVIGKDVPFALLQAIADEDEEALRQRLGRLQSAEFLYDHSFSSDVAYTFKHALTHEVAYGGIFHDRRRMLHARIADVIERIHATRLNEHVERLAHHALRGELRDKALAYLRQAATRAATRSAYREAVSFLEQALDVLRHLPESRERLAESIDIRLDLRNALLPLGRHREILAILTDAVPLAHALDDPQRLGWVYTHLTPHACLAGDYDRAVEAGQRASAIAEAQEEPGLQVMSTFFLSFVYFILGRHREAVEGLRRNAAVLQGALRLESFGQHGPLSVFSRCFLTWSLAELGEFAEGIVTAEEAIRIAESVDEPFTLMHAYLGLGMLRLRKGDVDQAALLLDRTLETCQRGDIQNLVAEITAGLGLAHALAGRVADGLSLLERAASERATGQVGREQIAVQLGEGYLLAGRFADADAMAQHALDLSRQHRTRGTEAYALYLAGAAPAHQDARDLVDVSAARYGEALALADALGMRPLVAHCRLGLGRLYQRIGQRGPAREHLASAATMYRAMEMTYWLAQAETAMNPSDPGARAHVSLDD